MTHSITFHTAEDKIIITFEDATTQEYIKSDKDQYLIDFPDRFADVEAMGTWTIDAGYGVDDLAVFVTSNGEVAVYKGSNPSDPTDWSLIGIWNIGSTFARKCVFKYGGDILLLTQQGLVPLSAGLQSTRLDPRVNITDKIFYAISQATDNYSSNFGWQINYLAKYNMLILNVPVTGGTEQYVMHNITKSWCRFTNISANCWEMSDEDMYFGGTGFVARFYDSFADAGTNIKGELAGDVDERCRVVSVLTADVSSLNRLPWVVVRYSLDWFPCCAVVSRCDQRIPPFAVEVFVVAAVATVAIRRNVR